MSSIFRTLSHSAEVVHDSLAPVDAGDTVVHPGLLTQRLDDLAQIAARGPVISPRDFPAYLDAVKNLNGVGLDDRKFLLEKLVTLMSRLPDDSGLSAKLEQTFIGILYKDLPHPPASYLKLPDLAPNAIPAKDAQGPGKVTYAYRSDDGSFNNVLFPSMGQAGSPYARTSGSTNTTPLSALPDPGLVFDTLLKRDMFVRHPGGISSLFFAFANLIIHSIFDTDHTDPYTNDTSSYLDLAPLYGGGKVRGFLTRTIEEMRVLDGTGRILEDCWADGRLTFMAPATGALLVLLNRNHNFIVAKLFDINERGAYAKPPPTDEKAKRRQDDELYHRARLVNCGYFMQIILQDYVGAILGLVRDGLAWRLNPLEQTRESGHELSPRGEGNVVSVEFNLMYRWHASTSEPDAQWTEEMLKSAFQGKPFNEVTELDFMNAAHSFLAPPANLKEWTFGGLKRDPQGRFRDTDLAKVLHDATEAPAAAFKARGIPECLRVIEIMGIEQSRQWGVCSLNEFRKFIGLKPYGSFKDWNSNPKIYKAAEMLYSDIDNLELHVGLQAEEAKAPMPGAGLCPGYTISRAILSDAVCLTRGDRFLTTDFTPYNLSAWGFQDCLADQEDGSYGGMLSKLLFQILPAQYPARSAYAHFGFMVPETMKGFVAARSEAEAKKYTWTRPQAVAPPVVVSAYADVKLAVQARERFSSGGDVRVGALTKGVVVDRPLVDAVLDDQPWLDKWAPLFGQLTDSLIKSHAVDHVGSTAKYVDIVKHVLNLVPVHFVANEIAGFPMKTSENPLGIYTDTDLYQKFATIGNYVLLDYDNYSDWKLREQSASYVEDMTDYIKAHLVKLSKGFLSVGGFSDTVVHAVAGRNDHSAAFLAQVLEAGEAEGRTHDEIAASVVAVAVTTAAQYASALAHVVDFYLDDAQSEGRKAIVALAAVPRSPDADSQLLGYVLEALRLNPPSSVVTRTAKANTVIAGTPVQAGQRVLASIAKGNLDPVEFGTNPHAVDLSRPAQDAWLWSFGEKGLLNRQFFSTTALSVIRSVFRLPNIQKAGTSGVLTSFTQDLDGVPQRLYISSKGAVTPYPDSLVVQYTV